MGKMEIPNHIPVDSQIFIDSISSLLQKGGLKSIEISKSGSIPQSSDFFASITLVPFIFICLEGHIDVALVKENATCVKRLYENEAVLFCSNSWPAVNNFNAPQCMRITFDTDHTLYGFHSAYRTRFNRPPHKDLEIYMCPKTVGALSKNLLNHLGSIASTKYHELAALQAANLLLAESVRQMAEDDPVQNSKARQTFMNICSYIRTNYKGPLTRQSVAELFNVSADHVSHLFKRFDTLTFNEFVENLRLEDAKAMLATNSLNISEIAYMCGFSTSNYFMRVFKKNFGISAGQYRSRA